MRPPGFTSGTARSRIASLLLEALLRARPAAPAIWRRDCAARRRCRCRAHRSARGRCVPARSASSLPTDSRRAHLDVARAGALKPRVDRRKPPLVVVGGVELAFVLHHRRERERLAAAAGAEVDHLLARPRAGEQRCELRALVLDFDEALEIGRLGMDRRAFCVSRKPDAQAKRRPAGRLRAQDRRAPLARLVAFALQAC